jgi:hypothetical protein
MSRKTNRVAPVFVLLLIGLSMLNCVTFTNVERNVKNVKTGNHKDSDLRYSFSGPGTDTWS